MSDTLVVKIDTSAAKDSLESLKTSVANLSKSLSNIDKKNDAFQRLIDALRGLDTSGIGGLASAFSALSQSSSQAATAASQVSRAARDANSSAKQASGATAQWATHLRNLAAAAAEGNSGMTGFQTGLTAIGAALARTGGGLAAATGQFGQLGVAIQTGMSNFNMLSGMKFSPAFAVGIAAITAAIVGLISILPDLASAIVRVNNEFTAFRNAMDAVRGQGAGTAAFEQLQGIASRTATDFSTLTKNFVGFEAAAKQMGFTTAQSAQMFEELAGAMRVLGVDGVKAERVLGAFQQMASKGKIMMEELKQQMGEALPTAIKAMANALGVSVEQMTKMLEQGQVSATILPRFTQELLKLSGGAEAVKRATQTLQAQLTALNNAWLFLADAFGKGLNVSFMNTLGAGLSQLTAALQSDNIKIFVAGIGDLVGVVGGALVSAFGLALQVISPFAAAWGIVSAAIASAIQSVVALATALGQFAGASAFLDGFINSFSMVRDATVAVTGALSDLISGFNEFWKSLDIGLGDWTEFGKTSQSILAALGTSLSGLGTAAGVITGLSLVTYAAVGAFTALNTALGQFIASQAVANVAGGVWQAIMGAYTFVTGAAAAALTGLARAAMVLNGVPLIGFLTAMSVGFVTLYEHSEKFKSTIDGLITRLSKVGDVTKTSGTAVLTYGEYVAAVSPKLAEVGARVQALYTTVSEQADLLLRASNGWTQYGTAADAAKIALAGLDRESRNLQAGMESIQRAQEMSSLAGKNFTIGIDTEIQALQRKQASLKDAGMETDVYATRISRLEEAKKRSALADEDASNRAKMERESLQASVNAINQKQQQLQELIAAQKQYGVALDESAVREARDLETAGLKADQAGKIVAAYELMRGGVDGFVRALEQEQQANERSRDVALERFNGLQAFYETLPKATEAEQKYASGIKQGIDAAAAAAKSKALDAAATRALILTKTEGLKIDEAQQRAYQEMDESLRSSFGGLDEFRKKLAEKQVEEAKSVASAEQVKQSQGELASATSIAAAKVKEMKDSVEGIGSAASTARAGIVNFGTGAKEASTNVTSVQETFTAFKTTMDSLAVSYSKVGEASNTFASSNETLARVLPTVTPLLRTLGETLSSNAPSFTAIGDASKNIGDGFRAWAEAMPNIGTQITALNEQLPQFSGSIQALATALASIKGSADGVTKMVEAITQAIPELDTLGVTLERIKSSAIGVSQAFENTLVTALETAAPKAAGVVDQMATDMVSDMDRIVQAVEAAIAAYRRLGEAQAGSGGGGGSTDVPAQRYGGYAGVSSESQTASISSFANAPKFANGTDNTNKFMRKLPGGGIPSILHPNEAVVPLPKGGSIPVEFRGSMGDQTASLASAVRDLSGNLEPKTMTTPPRDLYTSDKIESASKASRAAPSSAGRSRDDGVGEPPINVTLNITTPDADSFKRSQPQIKADAYRALREAYTRNG